MPGPRIPRTLSSGKPKPDVRGRVRHLAFVRQLPCVACGKAAPSEATNVRTGTDSGVGIKPGDATQFRYAPPVTPDSIGLASSPFGPRSASIHSMWLYGCGLCRLI
jgi:hypothetical protein